MTSFWERIFDPPSPEKNQQRLSAAQRQVESMRRRQSEARKKSDEQMAQIRRLGEDLQASRAQVDELREEIDRLTRCLVLNGVIEQADLDAMLPESEVQD